MNFGELATQLFGDPIAGSAVWAVVVLCVVQFALGSIRAFSNKTFNITSFDAWIRTDVAGRVIPIILIFLTAKAVPDLSVFGIPVESGLMAFGVAQATTYLISSLGSIYQNVRPPDPAVLEQKLILAAEAGDKIPMD